jgi:hypothetical protein
MSSSATIPSITGIGAPEVQAASAPVIDETDISYGRAIVIGSSIGILVFTAIVAAAVKLAVPDMAGGAVAVVAIWTGIWCGLFLGGTIAVGNWSRRQGH